MKKGFLLFTLAAGFAASAQQYTRRDSLQGGLRPERTTFDVQRYDLDITINPDERSVVGYNQVTFKVLENTSKIQLDLFDNMNVDSIVYNKTKLAYTRDNDAVFITFPNGLKKDSEESLKFYYSGRPNVAKNAPWDGGFVFKKDTDGKPWIGVAVQGTGASLWYPVKDHQTDEPDRGASIKVAVPNGLMNVSNGRFKGSEDLGNGYTRWDWEVTNPINNYDITINVADYAHIHDTHNGLDLDYYVLRKNEEKARVHFEEVKGMLDCFQQKFGQYPFAEDGYKLVETSYLGMEHQSAVAYGNKYKKGYMGMDMTGTGLGREFDYIIVHESGHEWFGNSITSKDIADMWIHEGFTTYSETVYVECRYGYDKAMQYINGQARNVENRKPVIGVFGVNKEGSGDMYYKGSLMLNTLRHITNDDTKWWKMLLGYSETYKKKIIDTETVNKYFSKEMGMDLTHIFNQYLRFTQIPILQLKLNGKNLEYRWQTDEKDFEMPVEILIGDKTIRLKATNKWKKEKVTAASLTDVEVATKKFYINVEKQQ
ncbi:peptidase M1 [Flavobacterium akiainvivens]|uniref:Peptidase M1 n=1 Tax=Flavobacterium akiainvivens TaxID=1202724 RepID=A0A0M9VGX3_9FLAO|nr:M1 family metallopeptidase [Flavobacterium akiainvivens]KOS04942.1 peptidase M1 [Flavobacterium akiainvivens]SFQ41729.1 Peptidase family M1 [Flavobacterium akiainvivens]